MAERTRTLSIADHQVGPGQPLFLIAEIGNAHDGSLNAAHRYVEAAAQTGAQAVKFQTHIAAAETTPREPFRVKFSRVDDTRFDYWKRMEFSEAQWQELADHARELGLVFLSSPFSEEAVAPLDRVGCPAWKVASGETNNAPLLDAMIATSKPLLVSTGMSYNAEIDAVAKRCEAAEAPYALFHCTTSYPCPPESVGLNVLEEFDARYDCPLGLSDHSGDLFAPLAAAALGVDLVEVHLCFSPHDFGPDVPASLTVERMTELARGLAAVRVMRQQRVDKDEAARTREPLRQMFGKSVVYTRDLSAGTVLGAAELTGKKPGDGVPVARIGEFIGRKLGRDVRADDPLQSEDLA